MVSSYMDLYVSREAQDAQTPRALYALLDRMYFHGRAAYDPCPHKRAAGFDGLKAPWRRLNYVNCEFSAAAKWLEKAEAEAARGNDSVLLLPARLCTSYFHRVLKSRWCRGVHLWLGKVTFVPFEQPLSTTMVTLCFGPVQAAWRPPRACAALSARRVMSDAWAIGPRADRCALAKAARACFGVAVPLVGVGRWPRCGVSMTVLDGDFARGVAQAGEHCRRWRDSVLLIVGLTAFHSEYVRSVRELVQGVVMYTPRLHVGGVEMVASGQVMIMAAKRPRLAAVARTPPVWLVSVDPHIITDRR